jgi:hypothetical protein
MSPEMLNSFVPGDFSVPNDRNHCAPCFTMNVTLQIVSTLFTMVGEANSPSTAGNGGLIFGFPRPPSRDERRPVSSPQM